LLSTSTKSSSSSSRTPNWSKSIKYTPLKLSDDRPEAGGGGEAEMDMNSEEEHTISDEIDIDFPDKDDLNFKSEGVPLVLKS